MTTRRPHGDRSAATSAPSRAPHPCPIEPHLVTQPLGDAARYLICSDGLTDAISDRAITDVLRDHDGGRATFELWKATIAAGAPDNVTIALLDIATRDSP